MPSPRRLLDLRRLVLRAAWARYPFEAEIAATASATPSESPVTMIVSMPWPSVVPRAPGLGAGRIRRPRPPRRRSVDGHVTRSAALQIGPGPSQPSASMPRACISADCRSRLGRRPRRHAWPVMLRKSRARGRAMPRSEPPPGIAREPAVCSLGRLDAARQPQHGVASSVVPCASKSVTARPAPRSACRHVEGSQRPNACVGPRSTYYHVA